MSINTTTTKSSTVQDAFNSGILGKESDASQKAPLGDILAILLDVANPSVTVSAVTATGAVNPTATGAINPTATGGVVLTATAVAAATAVSPASAAYASPDQSILAALANAEKVTLNALVTDVGAINTKLTQATVDITALATKMAQVTVDDSALATKLAAAVVDISALRSALAASLTGTMGGATETSQPIASNITGTLTYQANSVVSIRAYGGTGAGVLKLIRDPQHTLVAGEVFWDGNVGLKFCALDGNTSYDATYAKTTSGPKVSCLLAPITDIV